MTKTPPRESASIDKWSNVVTHNYNDPHEFIQELIKFSAYGIIHRGQGCSSWSLVPNLGRFLKTKSFDQQTQIDTLTTEIFLLSQFLGACDRSGIRVAGDSYQLRDELSRFSRLLNSGDLRQRTELLEQWPREKHPVLELMAQAQHHGVKTRLLDWTWSPIVAVCFSVLQFVDELEKQVYGSTDQQMFDLIQDRMLSVISFERNGIGLSAEDVILQVPGYTSENIAPQQGLFTLVKANSDFDLLDQSASHQHLQRRLIPARFALDIYQKCTSIGVSAYTLFPGYNGASKHVNIVTVLEWRIWSGVPQTGES